MDGLWPCLPGSAKQYFHEQESGVFKAPMFDVLRDWYQRHFSDPQAVALAIFLISLFAIVLVLGDILAPFFIAILFAYLLDGVVDAMQRWHIPRLLAVSIVLLLFLAFCLVLFLGLVPLLSQQITQLVRRVPDMIARGQEALLTLPQLYPDVFTITQIERLIDHVRTEVATFGQAILSFSVAQAVNVFTAIVYVVLVPLLVFFVLKDKHKLIYWAGAFMPTQRELSFRVWDEVDQKIANYIRGKFIEILIVWVATYIAFVAMGLDFSLLLSFLVGISVIIPYVGAIAVTIPVAFIAFFQFGFDSTFWYLMLAHLIIQALDGNLLVPILFSEVVNLHPVAIMVAVLFFGGVWGVWGVFFAIPLATLVQAVLNAWPSRKLRTMERQAIE